MSTGEITAIHTNITRKEHEQWKASAWITLSVLEKTTHSKYNQHSGKESFIPLSWLDIKDYLIPSLNLHSSYVAIEPVISIDVAKSFVENCDQLIPLIFTDDKPAVTISHGNNPAVNVSLGNLSIKFFDGLEYGKITGLTTGKIATISTPNSFLKHRLVIMYLLDCVKEDRFRPELLPEYLVPSFNQSFNFKWTGQPVNFDILNEFLLHCHYLPILINFSDEMESVK